MRLRLGLGRLRLGNVDDEALARFDLAGRLFYRPAVRQRHAAAFDQRLHAAAREGRQGSRQRAVQPLAGGAFVDGHDVALASLMEFSWRPLLQASAPLWLKVLVIVMGLLIVAGFVVIAAEIARRMSTPNAGRAASRRQPSAERIALPSGARVVSVTSAGDRLVVHVETPGGPAAAYIVDPRNGALLGTVEFPPGPGR